MRSAGRCATLGDEPVVRVHEVEIELLAQLAPSSCMSAFIVVDPADKRVDVLGKLGLAHAMNDHAVAELLSWQVAPAAGEDVHLDAFADEVSRRACARAVRGHPR